LTRKEAEVSLPLDRAAASDGGLELSEVGMRRTRLAGVILAASMIAGCSTTGPFGRERLSLPIGPSYVGGRGMQMFPNSPTLVANVKDAMSDVGVHSIIQNEDPSGLVILEGRTADDRKARVTIQTSGANSTVSAKVGWVGDEPLTRAMLDRLGSRQGTMPPQPTADETPTESTRPQPILSRDAVPDSVMLRDQIESGIIPTPH
jgi:hypothetical protein